VNAGRAAGTNRASRAVRFHEVTVPSVPNVFAMAANPTWFGRPAAMPADLSRVRPEFPALHQTVAGGKPLIYLDNAATTHKPRAVIDAVTRFYERDNYTVHLRLGDDGRVAAIGFEGSGCAISQASASIMTTQAKGETAAGIETAFGELKDILATGKTAADFNELSAFAGVHAFPARVKCATLPWHTVRAAMQQPEPSSGS
jgi:nitrogen fixation NifU-like protein